MVPNWTILNAMMTGNAMILKPFEVTPITSSLLANIFKTAGLPDGIFNIFNGFQDAVEALCDNEDIKALSFVGSTPVAKIVYKRASNNLKRALCLGEQKTFYTINSRC